MSNSHPEHHGHEAQPQAPASHPQFRFERFADAASAQAAFQALFPVGSQAEPALQLLASVGAQCTSVGAGRMVCRYVEKPGAAPGFCWHLVLDANSEKAIKRLSIATALLGM
jgi:hypothetical protein